MNPAKFALIASVTLVALAFGWYVTIKAMLTEGSWIYEPSLWRSAGAQTSTPLLLLILTGVAISLLWEVRPWR